MREVTTMYMYMSQSVALRRSVRFLCVFIFYFYFCFFYILVNSYQRNTNSVRLFTTHPFQTVTGFLDDHGQPLTCNSCKRKKLTSSATTSALSILTFFYLYFMASHIAFLCMVLKEIFSQLKQGYFICMNLDLNPLYFAIFVSIANQPSGFALLSL